MCKKCEKWLDEDYAIPLGKTLKLNCGIFGEIESELAMSKSMYDSSYRLFHYLGPMETDDSEIEYIKINYCPFCGRKLKESE